VSFIGGTWRAVPAGGEGLAAERSLELKSATGHRSNRCASSRANRWGRALHAHSGVGAVPAGPTRVRVPQSRWYVAVRARATPVPSYLGPIEDPFPIGDRAKTGICCGGGIRSAAFNLGALQALQSAGRLQTAKYLSAVSGGSYIAAAFCMVAKTPAPGDSDSDDSDPDLVTDDRPPFYHGSPEKQYLRNRSS
jgi:hypothetical protein